MLCHSIYLGEEGGPDRLNLLDVGSRQKSLELVGLLNENNCWSAQIPYNFLSIFRPLSYLGVHLSFLQYHGLLSPVSFHIVGFCFHCRHNRVRKRGSRHGTYGDIDAVIGEDESGVRDSELGVRHGD